MEPAQWTLDAVRIGRLDMQMAEARTRLAVQLARDEGASWEAIAAELGVTRQAATKRWATP